MIEYLTLEEVLNCLEPGKWRTNAGFNEATGNVIFLLAYRLTPTEALQAAGTIRRLMPENAEAAAQLERSVREATGTVGRA